MRRLRMPAAVAVLVLVAAGCGSDFGRYQKWSDRCRLDLATGEIVCWTGPRDQREYYVLMPAGRYSEEWNQPELPAPPAAGPQFLGADARGQLALLRGERPAFYELAPAAIASAQPNEAALADKQWVAFYELFLETGRPAEAEPLSPRAVRMFESHLPEDHRT